MLAGLGPCRQALARRHAARSTGRCVISQGSSRNFGNCKVPERPHAESAEPRIGSTTEVTRRLSVVLEEYTLLGSSAVSAAPRDRLLATCWTWRSQVSKVISPTMWFKSKAPVLGDFEQLVLLGVL